MLEPPVRRDHAGEVAGARPGKKRSRRGI